MVYFYSDLGNFSPPPTPPLLSLSAPLPNSRALSEPQLKNNFLSKADPIPSG